MPPKKKKESVAKAAKCDPKTCPVAAVLLDYFVGKFGNDAKPQIIKDLTALTGEE